MRFEGTYRELGPVDAGPLIESILAQDDDAWHANQHRQRAYDVHHQTESLVMIFCDGWPELKVSREAAWDSLKDTAVPLMRRIIRDHYPEGGSVIRAMAARLKAGGIIAPHWDSHESFIHSHRIHIPVTTNPGVRFTIDGRPHRLEVGRAYEINNQKHHSVINAGSEDRITFIFDYLPPKEQNPA
jgi:quercetin dioxygenase-like cupin family protein